MGFEPSVKSDIYGTYLGLVYLTPFIGGLLADRILGYRRSIVIGGLMMAAGYFCLSIHSNTSFFIALALIIVGNGFFKPNISTLVGNMYSTEDRKHLKDSGYNIFYMGINIGAFICNFVAAFMRINYGWGHAFAAAGVGMLIGVVIFLLGTKHIKDYDVVKPVQKGDMSTLKILGLTVLPMIVFGILGYFYGGVTDKVANPHGNILGSDTNDAFIFGCIPVAAFFAYLAFYGGKKSDSSSSEAAGAINESTDSAKERRALKALLAVFMCVILFFAIFHQNGDALTVWAEDYTNREMPSGVASVADKVGMAQTVTNNEIVSAPDSAFKKAIAQLEAKSKAIAGTSASDMKEKGKIGAEIDHLQKSRNYFKNLEKEKIPANNSSLKLYSTELYQSINPFWVVFLTPVVVGVWGLLRRRKSEPSTPTKIAIGLVITALSALVMVGAVGATNDLSTKASSFWLIASYGVITIGELCLSPMGLSLVSKLSPPRITSLMMGGFFLAISLGNKLSGMLSGLWEDMADKKNFFYLNFGLVMGAAVVLFIMLRWLNGVMKENNVQ